MPQGAESFSTGGGTPSQGAGANQGRGGAPSQGPGPGLTDLGAPGADPGPAGGGVLREGGALGLGAGLLPRRRAAIGQGADPSSEVGGASTTGTEALKGGAQAPGPAAGRGESPGTRSRGGLRGGRAWGRGRPRTPPGEVVWVEREQRAPDPGPVWVPRRPPRAQSWGGAPGGGGGQAWGVTSTDRGSPEPSGDVWVPRGRPPSVGEVWVCWAGGAWVWREWGVPVGSAGGQPERVWTLRKGEATKGAGGD
ncbi:translation initiation factor IF-2 [Dromiciops gliroides]|uniref:translation initiation factor IF-2 n=1 Tax=Dromiciops gliroides TaxID=33562 RepID=UPI001CC4A098|nr:translation initiation factor IF-2 [Dromiciops gliroides]